MNLNMFGGDIPPIPPIPPSPPIGIEGGGGYTEHKEDEALKRRRKSNDEALVLALSTWLINKDQ